MGITLGLTAGIKIISALLESEEKMRNNASNATASYKESQESLNDYKTEIDKAIAPLLWAAQTGATATTSGLGLAFQGLGIKIKEATTLNDLCRILHCDIGDIVKYIPSDADQPL